MPFFMLRYILALTTSTGRLLAIARVNTSKRHEQLPCLDGN